VDGTLSTKMAGKFQRTDYLQFSPSQYVESDVALDDLRYYNHPLTPAQMAAVFSGSP
jgi:hypothetical protein